MHPIIYPYYYAEKPNCQYRSGAIIFPILKGTTASGELRCHIKYISFCSFAPKERDTDPEPESAAAITSPFRLLG